LLGQGGHWFPGKNAAEFDEQALRAAVSASPLADRSPDLLREAHELFFDKPVERLGRD
jgi:predicted aldo/keto reductase-like oxidoreductase